MPNINELFPCPSKAFLQNVFVGKHLSDVSVPAAVLDRVIVKDNCNQMLKACRLLGVQFRPHIKTHKVITVINDLNFVRLNPLRELLRCCAFILRGYLSLRSHREILSWCCNLKFQLEFTRSIPAKDWLLSFTRARLTRAIQDR